MALKDEIREEQKKVKDRPLSGKIKYIWDYYKIHIIVGIFVVIFLAVFVKDWINNSKPVYLNVVALNTVLDYNSDFDPEADLAAYAGIDPEEERVVFDTSMRIDLESNTQIGMASEQKILALFTAEEIDVMMAPEAIANFYAKEDAFVDIRTYLSDAEIKALSDRGYPVYYATCEGQTIPAGFYLNNSAYLKRISEHGTFIPEDNAVITFTYCNKHPEASLQLLRMITE